MYENDLDSTSIQFVKLVNGCLVKDCIQIEDMVEQKSIIEEHIECDKNICQNNTKSFGEL